MLSAFLRTEGWGWCRVIGKNLEMSMLNWWRWCMVNRAHALYPLKGLFLRTKLRAKCANWVFRQNTVRGDVDLERNIVGKLTHSVSSHCPGAWNGRTITVLRMWRRANSYLWTILFESWAWNVNRLQRHIRINPISLPYYACVTFRGGFDKLSFLFHCHLIRNGYRRSCLFQNDPNFQ